MGFFFSLATEGRTNGIYIHIYSFVTIITKKYVTVNVKINRANPEHTETEREWEPEVADEREQNLHVNVKDRNPKITIRY